MFERYLDIEFLECTSIARGGQAFDADAAGNAFLALEGDLAGFGIEFETAGGADGDTGAAGGAAVFVAGDIPAECLDSDTGIGEISNTLIVISPFAA